MSPIEFEQQNTVFAKDQKEYIPLPAYVDPGPERNTVSVWQLTPEEILQIQETGIIYLSMWTFGNPLQPVMLSVESPFKSDNP